VSQIEAVLQAAHLLDGEQRKLEWRDVRVIRQSDEPTTRLARRYTMSETLVRRVRRREIWVTQRPREAMRLPAGATLSLAGPRVSGDCRLDEPNVDLAACRIRMLWVKTNASERTVRWTYRTPVRCQAGRSRDRWSAGLLDCGPPGAVSVQAAAEPLAAGRGPTNSPKPAPVRSLGPPTTMSFSLATGH
jgi:hypothetical protein